MSGFQFTETMSGTFTLSAGDGAERPMLFTCQARASNLWRHLADRRAELDGHVDMEGFATRRPLQGHIVIDPILGGRIAYDFQFDGDDGKPYRFSGQKDVSPFRPWGSMTTLPGAILDERGAEVARAHLRFEAHDLPGLLGSFRPIL
jgi:hypothetical protein